MSADGELPVMQAYTVLGRFAPVHRGSLSSAAHIVLGSNFRSQVMWRREITRLMLSVLRYPAGSFICHDRSWVSDSLDSRVSIKNFNGPVHGQLLRASTLLPGLMINHEYYVGSTSKFWPGKFQLVL